MPPRKRKAPGASDSSSADDAQNKRPAAAPVAEPAPAPPPAAEPPAPLSPADDEPVVVARAPVDAGRVRSQFLRVGDMLSSSCYYKVMSVWDGGDKMEVKNVDDPDPGVITVRGRSISETQMYSARQYSRIEKVTRTEMVERMKNAKDVVFTVNFHKQASPKDALEVVDQMAAAQLPLSQREKTKRIREQVLLGPERTMVAHLIDTEPEMGRSRVVDLELPLGAGTRERLVDHRTVNWLVLRDVKYEQK